MFLLKILQKLILWFFSGAPSWVHPTVPLIKLHENPPEISCRTLPGAPCGNISGVISVIHPENPSGMSYMNPSLVSSRNLAEVLSCNPWRGVPYANFPRVFFILEMLQEFFPGVLMKFLVKFLDQMPGFQIKLIQEYQREFLKDFLEKSPETFLSYWTISRVLYSDQM